MRTRPSKPNRSKRNGLHFMSRFGDSDDEEPSRLDFRSRFDDSSDDDDDNDNGDGEEEKHHHLLFHHRHRNDNEQHEDRPVRGIPRLRGMHDGDSTELEDSSEDEAPGMNSEASALAAVARSRGMTAGELDDFLHRPAIKPRKGGGGGGGFLQRLHVAKTKSHSVNGTTSPVVNSEEKGRSKKRYSWLSPSSSSSSSPKFHKRVQQHNTGNNNNHHSTVSNRGSDFANNEQQPPPTPDSNVLDRQEGCYAGALMDVAITPKTPPQKKTHFTALRKAFGLTA